MSSLLNFQPSDALPPPRVTGMILPFSANQYGDQRDVQFAVPSLLSGLYDATVGTTGRAISGELGTPSINNPIFTGAVADMGANIAGGGLLGSKLLPNAVPSGGILGMGVSNTPKSGLLGKVDNVQPKSGVSKVVPPTDKTDGIIAFHGSPYDFNQFSLSKINTGEGAQAFGNGLYFSSKEDIAKFYRDSVRGYKDLKGKFDFKYKGKDFNINPAEAKTKEELGVSRIIEHSRQIRKNPEEAKKQLIIALSKEADKAKRIDDEELQGLLGFSYSKELDAVKSIDTSNLVQSKGNMYQVKLNTINDDLIDYDKTLGEQTPRIQSIINKLKSEVIVDDAINLGFDPFDYGGNEKKAIEEAKKVLFGKNETVERFLNNWAVLRGQQGTAEKLMTKYGAKGIQYLDNSSRGKRFSIKLSTNKGSYDHEPIQSGDRSQIEEMAKDYRKKGFKVKIEEGGDKNFVIFDDKIIDILKKYGIAGAVGVTAMQGRGNQSPESDI